MKRSALWGALVGLVIIALSLAATAYFKRSQRTATFKATQSAFMMVLDIQALAINDGYFSWTELQNYVYTGQRQEAEAQLDEIITTYPFVKDVAVKPGIPPSESFYIYGYEGLVHIDFSLKNDFGSDILPGWTATVSLDAQKLLDSLPVGERLVVDKIRGEDFAYDLKVGFDTSLINIWDILFIYRYLAWVTPLILRLKLLISAFLRSFLW